MRAKIERGTDPVEEPEAAKAALGAISAPWPDVDLAVDRRLAAKLHAFKNAKHRQKWENPPATYASPEPSKMLVRDITTPDVLRTLQPIWRAQQYAGGRGAQYRQREGRFFCEALAWSSPAEPENTTK